MFWLYQLSLLPLDHSPKLQFSYHASTVSSENTRPPSNPQEFLLSCSTSVAFYTSQNVRSVFQWLQGGASVTWIRVMSRTNESTALRRRRRSLEKPRLLRRLSCTSPSPYHPWYNCSRVESNDFLEKHSPFCELPISSEVYVCISVQS